MNKLVIYLISLLVVFNLSCSKDEDGIKVPQEVESKMGVTIDGNTHDTVRYNCIKTYIENRNGLRHIEGKNRFILRQGYWYELSSDVMLKTYLYIYDTSNLHNIYSTELLADYIENDKAYFEVQLERNGELYKNMHYSDWSVDGFLNRTVVNEDRLLEIENEQALIDLECADLADLLPVDIYYQGFLTNHSGSDSIRINDLSTKMYLIELYL